MVRLSDRRATFKCTRAVCRRMLAVSKRSAVIHAGFALTGVVTTLLGPIIPALSASWSLNDAQAGYLFTAQFGGSITGVVLTTQLTGRLGYVRLLVLGFLMICI